MKKILLDKEIIDFLKKRRNLLAFSGGVDSVALFFILQQEGIDFDIAIVNYKKRKQAFEEVKYAKRLSKEYKKRFFIKEASIREGSFEKKARDIRYAFFEEIIKDYSYDVLITAHQLNDLTEWFLMQFAKGAGLVELIGMEPIVKRDFYTIARPLLFVAKEDLVLFLESKKIKYFLDFSNFDEKYRRNYFRKNFSNRLVREYKDGIKRSFHFLIKDRNVLLKDFNFKTIKELYVVKKSFFDSQNMRFLDKIFKRFGILLSFEQKKEIIRQKNGVFKNIAFGIGEEIIFVAPYKKTDMPKSFREKCRISKIPPSVRGYIFEEIGDDFELLKSNIRAVCYHQE